MFSPYPSGARRLAVIHAQHTSSSLTHAQPRQGGSEPYNFFRAVS
jgi:hypothetical protein